MALDFGSIIGLVGGLSGGSSQPPRLPPELLDMLTEAYENTNYEGFLPDQEAFEASGRAEIADIMAQLPISTEAFGADLAARGLGGAGEAPRAYYRDVVAPIGRAAATVGAQARLDYAKALQYGNIAAEQFRLSNLDRILGYHETNLGYEYQTYQTNQANQAAFWGEIGGAFDFSEEIGTYLQFANLGGGAGLGAAGGSQGTQAPLTDPYSFA